MWRIRTYFSFVPGNEALAESKGVLGLGTPDKPADINSAFGFGQAFTEKIESVIQDLMAGEKTSWEPDGEVDTLELQTAFAAVAQTDEEAERLAQKARNYIQAFDRDLPGTPGHESLNGAETGTIGLYADDPIQKTVDAVAAAKAKLTTMPDSAEKTALMAELQAWESQPWNDKKGSPSFKDFAATHRSVQDWDLHTQELAFAENAAEVMPTIVNGIVRQIAADQAVDKHYQTFIESH